MTVKWSMKGTVEVMAVDEEELLDKKVRKVKWDDLKDREYFNPDAFEIVTVKKVRGPKTASEFEPVLQESPVILKASRKDDDEDLTKPVPWLVTMSYMMKGDFEFQAPDDEEIAMDDFWDVEVEKRGGSIKAMWKDFKNPRYVGGSMEVEDVKELKTRSAAGINVKPIYDAIEKANAHELVMGMMAEAKKAKVQFGMRDAKAAIELWFDGAKEPKDDKGKAARAYLDSDKGKKALERVIKAVQTELKKAKRPVGLKDVAEYVVRWFGE